MWAIRKATFGAEGSLTAFVRASAGNYKLLWCNRKKIIHLISKAMATLCSKDSNGNNVTPENRILHASQSDERLKHQAVERHSEKKMPSYLLQSCCFENLKNSQNPQGMQTTIVGMPGLHHTYFNQAIMGENWMQSNGTWTGMKFRWWTTLQGSLEALPTSLEFNLRKKLQACPSSNNFKFCKQLHP